MIDCDDRMKRILLVCLLFLLAGCTSPSNDVTTPNSYYSVIDNPQDFVEEEPFFYYSTFEHEGLSIPVFLNEFVFDENTTYLFNENINGFDGYWEILPRTVYFEYQDNPGSYVNEDKTVNAFAVANFEVVDSDTRKVHTDVYNRESGALFLTIDSVIGSGYRNILSAHYFRNSDKQRIVAYHMHEDSMSGKGTQKYFGEELIYSADGTTLISKEILQDNSDEFDSENDLSYLKPVSGKLTKKEMQDLLNSSTKIADNHFYILSCLSMSRIDESEKVYIPNSVYQIKNYYYKEADETIDLVKLSKYEIEKLSIDKETRRVIDYSLTNLHYSYVYNDNSIDITYETVLDSGNVTYDLNVETGE